MVPDTRPRRDLDPGSRYFLFLRWMRVFLSSLRCFFLAILLRRFLMTEPTAPPSASLDGTGTGTLARPSCQGQGTRPVKPTAWPSRSTPPAQRSGVRPFSQVAPGPFGSGQLEATKASLRYWFTACSGTRKDRPTRIASSSPE